MIKLKRFNETIGNYKQYYNFQYKVDLTDHASDRKSRHGKEDGKKPISNDEIIAALKKANDKIVEAIINNNINVNTKGRFIVRVKSTGLNIVCGAHTVDKSDDTIEITVITVGRFGNEFKNQGNTFTIEI